jgi:hypothetical protein
MRCRSDAVGESGGRPESYWSEVCILFKIWRFHGDWLQWSLLGRPALWEWSKYPTFRRLPLPSTWFGTNFYLEDGGNTFFRINGSHLQDNKASQPRSPQSIIDQIIQIQAVRPFFRSWSNTPRRSRSRQGSLRYPHSQPVESGMSQSNTFSKRVRW